MNAKAKAERKHQQQVIRDVITARRLAIGIKTRDDMYAQIVKAKQRLQESGCIIQTRKKAGVYSIVAFKQGHVYRATNVEWFLAANEVMDLKDQHNIIYEESKLWRHSPDCCFLYRRRSWLIWFNC